MLWRLLRPRDGFLLSLPGGQLQSSERDELVGSMHDMPRRQLLPYAWPLRADALPGWVLLPESEYDNFFTVPNRQVCPHVRLLRPVAGFGARQGF